MLLFSREFWQIIHDFIRSQYLLSGYKNNSSKELIRVLLTVMETVITSQRESAKKKRLKREMLTDISWCSCYRFDINLVLTRLFICNITDTSFFNYEYNFSNWMIGNTVGMPVTRVFKKVFIDSPCDMVLWLGVNIQTSAVCSSTEILILIV